MSSFNLTLYSGKKFHGEIIKAHTIDNDKYITVSPDSLLTRYTGSWDYEKDKGFLSIDVELDVSTNNINSIDVLITNSSNIKEGTFTKLQEDVGIQLVIEDYLLKNIKL